MLHGNEGFFIVKKSNISLYVTGLGIVGTDVISSGIPLPDGISLTDNICIIKYSNAYWLNVSKNLDNYFKLTDTNYYCKTSSGSNAYYSFYSYDSGTSTFKYYDDRNKGNIQNLNNASIVYSYNDVVINDTTYYYASKNFLIWNM